MKIMTDFLPSKKDLLNAMAAIAAPVNKAIKKGQETLTDIADWLWVVIQGDYAEAHSKISTINRCKYL